MNKELKSIILFSFLFMLLIINCSNALSQGNIWRFPAFQSQPLQAPSWSEPLKGEGDILVDNFEYWDSPYNHGWIQEEPSYPVYGFGQGYATFFQTVLDLREGSRVLDVYRPSSVFLIHTPFERHGIYYRLYTPPLPGATSVTEGIDLLENPILSFKFRAPIGIDPWDIFEFDVIGITHAGHDIMIRIRPVQPPFGSYHPGNSADKMGGYLATVADMDASDGSMVIHADIGRNFLDGSWHVVWLNLRDVVKKALDGYEGRFGVITQSDWQITKAERILVRGRMFRLDDIAFRAKQMKRLDQPDLIEPGPLYAQIFESYRYLFMAEYAIEGDIAQITDLLLDPENFITDPNQIRDTWISDLLRLDPNYHVIDSLHPQYDPDYPKRWILGDPNYGKPDPVAETYLRDGFFIDSTLPIFSDPNFRLGGLKAAELRDHGVLGWNLTIGGYGKDAIQALMIRPLPVNPYDGMPTYIFAYYSSIPAIKKYGRSHYGPTQCFSLESALWNMGLELWPNIAYVDYEPQYFEDLIVTLEVTNGSQTDVRTFPISVVNYPVENYPPVLQIHVPRRIFYYGKQNEYTVRFTDPDCYIFSLAQFKGGTPATTHLPMLPGNPIRTDQDHLYFRMTLDGLPAYQYGPWIEDIIDPHNGFISFTMRFEGIFNAVVTCTDDRGASIWSVHPLLREYRHLAESSAHQ